jgi:DNA-binding Lrp family transcriptional regulator
VARSRSLDQTDREIIALLQHDARRTFGDIGQRVALSSAAVKRRVDRLERSGAIVGYTAVVDDAGLGRPLAAFAQLRITGSTDVGDIVALASSLPEVEAVYVTAGDPDFLVQLRVADTARLMEIINHLRGTRRVVSTRTLMVLDSWERPRAAGHDSS